MPDVASDASAAVQSTPYNISSSYPYAVRDISGKGKGAVATRHIQRGETVIAEQPVMLARLDLFGGDGNNDGQREQGDHDGLMSLLEAALFQLPESTQQVVHSLARQQIRSNTYDGAFVEDILRTNGLGVTVGDVAHTGLYPLISRMNHACRPNTFWRYSPRTLVAEFVALRDIDAGEELTHSYTQRETVEATRHELHVHWGFNCSCEVCSSAGERHVLDEKMVRLREIEAKLAGGEGDNIQVLTDEMMALVDGDDALRAPRGAYSYHLVVAAQAAWSTGNEVLAREYAVRALAAAEEYGGPDDSHAAVLREVLAMM